MRHVPRIAGTGEVEHSQRLSFDRCAWNSRVHDGDRITPAGLDTPVGIARQQAARFAEYFSFVLVQRNDGCGAFFTL